MWKFRKKKIVIIQIFRSKKLPKSMKFDKFGKKRRGLQFFVYFFFKFTRLLRIKNKYVYISEKIN